MAYLLRFVQRFRAEDEAEFMALEAQFAALAMGAHPYRVCQLHWHAADYRPLLEKMGVDWRERWREFEDDLARLKANPDRFLTWADADGEWAVPMAHPEHARHGGT